MNHSHLNLQGTRKEKVTSLAQLKPGDHVSFYRSDLSYSHHGIVLEVQTNSFLIIHYAITLEMLWDSLVEGSLYFAEVIQSEWKVDLDSSSEELYLNHYDQIKCFSNEETVRRAMKAIGKRGYSLMNNNCEHWARWCRTGDAYSEQVSNICHRLKQKTATLLIVDPVALFVKDLTAVAGISLGTFLGRIGSGLTLGAIEAVSTFIDIRRKQIARREGSISEMAFKKYVVRRVTSAGATVRNQFSPPKESQKKKPLFIKIAGGVAGTIVGTVLVPVPIIGSVAGGMVGTLTGKILGGLAGIPIAKCVELYNRFKHEDESETETISRLMIQIARDHEKLIQGLTSSAAEEFPEEVSTESTGTNSTLYLLFEQLIKQYPFMADEQCLEGIQLVRDMFSDEDESESFVLTPIPDKNAPEQFASMPDLLVLRWPSGTPQPWHDNSEDYVLNINPSNIENKNV